MRTAWSDKHPAYDILNGNDPDNQPHDGPGTNIDDFFAPEINSDLSQKNLDLIKTQLGANFSTAPLPIPDPSCPGPSCGKDFTSTVPAVEWYDGIKVRTILNEINGLDHTGKHRVGTPALFGMNFQAVSVGQKLTDNGYIDSRGTPSAGLADAIAFVDRSVADQAGATDDDNLHGSPPLSMSGDCQMDSNASEERCRLISSMVAEARGALDTSFFVNPTRL